MSNIRNIRRQVVELRRQVHADRIVLSMPDGSEVSFPDRGDAVPRLLMRAFDRLGARLNGYEPPEPDRRDEALALILQAVEVRSPVPELQTVVRGLLAKASDSQPDVDGAPGA